MTNEAELIKKGYDKAMYIVNHVLYGLDWSKLYKPSEIIDMIETEIVLINKGDE